jgi:hypothetical protein
MMAESTYTPHGFTHWLQAFKGFTGQEYNMKRYMFLILMGCLVLYGTLSLAKTRDIAYRGWTGRADVMHGRFAGCHLDSPSPTPDLPGESIRVVSDSLTQFFIELVTYSGALLRDPLLKGGELFAVGLGTMNGHEDSYAKYEREDFQARFLGRGVDRDRKPFSRIAVALNTDDPLVSHLQGAQRLKIMITRPGGSPGDNSLSFDLLNLRHRSLAHPKTWLRSLSSNDTYGAMKEVLSCVARHAH